MINLCRSALETITTMELEYPLMFQIKFSKCFPPKVIHCGVEDFSAPEGVAYMPRWMMRNLGLAVTGDTSRNYATISTVSLPPATFVQFQPQSVSFLDISNPKAVLEQVLRKSPTLTKGSTILFCYNNKDHYMKVLDIQPDNPAGAVCTLNADVSVDFAAPVGYVEPERPKQVIPVEEEEDPLQTSYSSFSEESSEEMDDFAAEGGGGSILTQLSATSKRKPKLLPVINSKGNIEYKGEADVNELRESKKKEQKELQDKLKKEEEERKKKEEEGRKNMTAFTGKGEVIR